MRSEYNRILATLTIQQEIITFKLNVLRDSLKLLGGLSPIMK